MYNACASARLRERCIVPIDVPCMLHLYVHVWVRHSCQLMHFLNTKKLLCDNQFGFREKNQTTHVVQSMLNNISREVNNNKNTIATFIDLSKAFDYYIQTIHENVITWILIQPSRLVQELPTYQESNNASTLMEPYQTGLT